MKYEAVIFDLFGTLVYPVSEPDHQRMLTEIASALSINPDIFKRLWAQTTDRRMNGIFRNYWQNIEYIYRQIGTTAEENRINLATHIRLSMVRNEAVPRADAIAVLSKLKTESYKTGFITVLEFPQNFESINSVSSRLGLSLRFHGSLSPL